MRRDRILALASLAALLAACSSRPTAPTPRVRPDPAAYAYGSCLAVAQHILTTPYGADPDSISSLWMNLAKKGSSSSCLPRRTSSSPRAS